MSNNGHSNLKEGFKTEESMQALSALKSLSSDASPYLKNRVLRNIESQAVDKKTALPWVVRFFQQFKLAPSLAVATLTLALSFLFFNSNKLFLKQNPEQPTFNIGQAYVIRFDIRPLPNENIAYAEITLPDENVQFASLKFDDIKTQKKLVVSWEGMLEKQYMPIVVQGTKAGASKVIVNFYDSDRNLVTSKEVSLYFKGGA
jgi:hypothetical protein